MPARSPITVAVTRFPDLLALGLQTALDADPSMAVVAGDVPAEQIESMLRVRKPRVLALDSAV
jgi:hypothetical protein